MALYSWAEGIYQCCPYKRYLYHVGYTESFATQSYREIDATKAVTAYRLELELGADNKIIALCRTLVIHSLAVLSS